MKVNYFSPVDLYHIPEMNHTEVIGVWDGNLGTQDYLGERIRRQDDWDSLGCNLGN